MKRILYIILICISVSPAFSQVSIIVPAKVDGPSMKSVNGKVIYGQEGALQWEYELWATDGTPAGTALVKDINPNFASDLFSSMTQAGAAGLKRDAGKIAI